MTIKTNKQESHFHCRNQRFKIVEQKIQNESTIKLPIKMINKTFSSFQDKYFYYHKKKHRKHDYHH